MLLVAKLDTEMKDWSSPLKYHADDVFGNKDYELDKKY